MKITRFVGNYSFLSNFHVIKGFPYKTVEHVYQACKTVNREERKAILASKTPGQAKRAGRKATLRPDWDLIKLDVMEWCLRRKFEVYRMKDGLLSTGNMKLIEGNTWHDNFWGDCSCHNCANIEGENHLGKLLMKIRWELRKERQK